MQMQFYVVGRSLSPSAAHMLLLLCIPHNYAPRACIVTIMHVYTRALRSYERLALHNHRTRYPPLHQTKSLVHVRDSDGGYVVRRPTFACLRRKPQLSGLHIARSGPESVRQCLGPDCGTNRWFSGPRLHRASLASAPRNRLQSGSG